MILFQLILSLFFLSLIHSENSQAKISIVTTTTDLRVIAAEVGGAFVLVESIARGTQDPHQIEAKPSFMLKVHKADLLVSIGLDLEIGWLPSILQGARNPKILKGQRGILEVGSFLDPLDAPTGKLTRAAGDVHPFGNPHVWLDPERAAKIAELIAGRLGEIDPENTSQFSSNAQKFRSRMVSKTKIWQSRIKQTSVTKAVSYHKTLTYFLNRFNIENPAILEPKPGTPPTGGHIIGIIHLIRAQKIPLILVENFFDPTVTNRIKQEIPTIRTETVPVSVGGTPEIHNLDDLYETLVLAIEGKSRQ